MKTNTHLAKLHKKYQLILEKKRIHTTHGFDLIIRQDLKKIVHSLYELKNISTMDLITRFFSARIHRQVSRIICGNARSRLHHIGFEIYEPMDLVVNVFKQQMKKYNNENNSIIKVLKIQRFPASQAFQARVNAYSEIMRLWIKLYQSTYMLELFDIHHPVHVQENTAQEQIIEKPMIEHLLSTNKSIAPKKLMPNRRIFKSDAIWHYAIHVRNQDIVRQLHACFKKWVHDHSDYKLAFASIVTNANDGSFLTKIINIRQGIELEFIAQQDT